MNDIEKVFGSGICANVETAARESPRMFVRSRTQLGLLKEGDNPPGHIMTAWEAYQSYGFGILDEAVEYGAAILLSSAGAIERSLSGQREELGLSFESLTGAVKVDASTVRQAEVYARDIPVQTLEKVCFVLGLDERLLAFDEKAGADHDLAFRLKTLQQPDTKAEDSGLSAGTVLTFTEAASVIRVQSMLMDWLGLSNYTKSFRPLNDYGSPSNPAWRLGYNLAEQMRSHLGLGIDPILSMRELVENTLNVPVVQAQLQPFIAGATIETRGVGGGDVRGFILNTIGENTNVWVRRATLSHELGHLLYDPSQRLNRLLVDSYNGTQSNPQTNIEADYVEQRANAFAIAFLAPLDSVRKRTPPPVVPESLGNVMQAFGISHTAARHHVSNAHFRQYPTPDQSPDESPSEDWRIAEDFTLDYFPINSVPLQRRGRFAGLVAEAWQRRLLSSQTAAFYLGCAEREFLDNAEAIRNLHPIG